MVDYELSDVVLIYWSIIGPGINTIGCIYLNSSIPVMSFINNNQVVHKKPHYDSRPCIHDKYYDPVFWLLFLIFTYSCDF